MKKVMLVLMLASLFPVLTPGHDAYRLEKKDSVSQVIQFSHPEKAKTVTIDNVFGSITVSGVKTNEVRLQARKSLRADSEAELLKAEHDVKLSIAEKDNQLDIYVDGPFRRRDGSTDWTGHDYIAVYDFILQVPEQTSLILKTVNEGDILVEHVEGDFSIRNVNGRIELQDIAGAVSCKTVNGRIQAAFRKDPLAACAFTTVNGDLDVRFGPGLAADFKLKTLNGEIYTDYANSTYLPVNAAGESSTHQGRYVYRSQRSQGVRVGAGGPEIRMETINGDIVIANKNKKGA